MFDQIFDAIDEWMRNLLTGMVDSNLETMFTDVNEKTSEIATQVGMTPQGWNSSIYSMVRNLSNSVIVPIAGIIITMVLCYELISMLTERNNMHEIDTWMLQDFLEETEEADTTGSSTGTVVLEEQTISAETSDEQNEGEEPAITEDEESSSGAAVLLVLVLAAAGCGGAYFYFKVYKPKHDADAYESEGMEIGDGLETINEDEAGDGESDDEE